MDPWKLILNGLASPLHDERNRKPAYAAEVGDARSAMRNSDPNKVASLNGSQDAYQTETQND